MSDPSKMAGMRLFTSMDWRAMLSKVTASPTFPLVSVIATSAQFQNSSGLEDIEVHELVVM